MPWISRSSADGGALTVPVPAESFRYLGIALYNTAIRTGGATPVIVTTTGSASPTFNFPTSGALGTMEVQVVQPFDLPNPRGGTMQITCPATTGVIWNVTCFY